MPIKVACQCGQRFAAKDEYLGKRVQCPKCGTTLTIGPAPVAAVVPPVASPRQAPVASPPPDDGGFPWGDDFGGVPAKPAVNKPKPAKASAAANPRAWIIVDTGLAISFASLIVGGLASAIFAITGVAMTASPDLIPGILSGSGGWLAMLLMWVAVAWLGSYVSLFTGWRVCWAVPKATKTRPIIQASLGCIGASFAMVLLMQMLALATAPSVPSPASMGQPRNLAEIKKFQADVEQAGKDAANAKTMRIIGKAVTWLTMLASVAGVAAFGLFLGLLAEYCGAALLKLHAIYFCMLQGALRCG